MFKKLYKYDDEEMLFVPIFTTLFRQFCYLTILPISIIFIFIQIGYILGSNNDNLVNIFKNDISYEKEIVLIDTLNVFTEKKLIDYLLKLNVKFPDIVFSQARYETGNFKSLIFIENNNLFGMKVANSRSTTNLGEQHNHAVFNSWEMSVIDYALWQNSYTRKIKTREEYLKYLKNVYAEGTYSSIHKILSETQKKYPELMVTYPFRD